MEQQIVSPMQSPQPTGSKSRRELEIASASLRESLKISGMEKPATILNFNPVQLVIEDGLIQGRIPSGGNMISVDAADPKLERVRFQGREYVASRVTLHTAIIYPRLRGILKSDSGDAIGDREPRAILPIEQVFKYYHGYNDAGGNNVGGVVIFEGDGNVLHRKGEGADEIMVPFRQMLSAGNWTYGARKGSLKDEVSKALSKQRIYGEGQLQNAQTRFDDPAHQMGAPTRVDKVWAQYAMDMGWIEKLPVWCVDHSPAMEKCSTCGMPRQSVEAWLCSGCHSPYDPKKSFLEGKPIAESLLYGYTGEDLAAIKKEMKRRKAMFAE
jgi:hypothetical protein